MHVPPYLEDIIDQLAIALILREGPVGAGKRLSLIVVDNAVEYMLKVYVIERKLVGTKAGQIDPTQWEKTRRDFGDLIWFVKAKANLPDDMVQKIVEYHGIRNDLYHDTRPQEPYQKHFDDYLNQARELLAKVFSRALGPPQWQECTDSVRQQIFGKKSTPTKVGTKTQVAVDISKPAITFETEAKLSLVDMILIAVHGYLKKQLNPTVQQISDALEFSGYQQLRSIINTRLGELVRQEKLSRRKGFYSMRTSGIRILQKKFDLKVI